jgi:hypothetical protein
MSPVLRTTFAQIVRGLSAHNTRKVRGSRAYKYTHSTENVLLLLFVLVRRVYILAI